MTLRPALTSLVPGLFLVAASTSFAGWAEMQIERTVRNIAAVQSYHGVLEQQGLYGDDMVKSEIWFQRPHDFHSHTSAPASLAGSVTRYTGDTLMAWLPTLDIAVIIRNLPAAPAEQEAKRIEDAWRENTRRYFYALGNVSKVAGHDAIELKQKARNPDDLIQHSRTQVLDQYSFPLAGDISLHGGDGFSYRYQHIEFNQPITLPEAPTLPASAMQIEWDLDWPDASGDAVTARLPAIGKLPDALLGLPLQRRLIHPGALPAVAGYYSDGNYFVLLTAARDFGLPNPAPYGLDVTLGKDKPALLVLTPLINTWSFASSGVAWTVTSNQHPELIYSALRNKPGCASLC
ncbi:hypothetical protein MWU49_17635 [Alcanivorax sp. S6407]|jgi:hypothetical protein|uniref:LolA family protein n=1 Tax=unclassified Alcanivorax TaxID=2638842 RepID=UPI0012BC8B98|nr:MULTISPECIES: hypothetical protein [unclassified Alcanivorax]MCK0155536.1 hypothetical protein [Alcanivorax sp. S6407]MTT54265.1 hypothetical protein [Alcanivorax sp. VBW004]|tara:strand:- start:1038 stop:2078 length:1041 start_codon:yes stop_codon:yes gene_type:complete